MAQQLSFNFDNGSTAPAAINTIPQVAAGDPYSNTKDLNRSHSIDSYYDAKEAQRRESQRMRVLKAISELITASDREIAVKTGLSLSVIPARRGKLLEQELIEIAGEKIDTTTQKLVTYYRVKESI